MLSELSSTIVTDGISLVALNNGGVQWKSLARNAKASEYVKQVSAAIVTEVEKYLCLHLLNIVRSFQSLMQGKVEIIFNLIDMSPAEVNFGSAVSSSLTVSAHKEVGV